MFLVTILRVETDYGQTIGDNIFFIEESVFK